ncbi:uncharacterized protein LOC121870398 [Homarus americanus]|uniref:uncharacterized protein LOC121870398 n=1 Tax=Homarus americanus TaxID=6706 RepID=UPI001C45C266|nr:uncharacterized protein LOC121870398 [Homarus americanus]XP_042228160.1 uncharacterized protein LOC121870398 [Homarus americanus]
MNYRANEELLSCPYEPSHQILPHRMAQHLVKCKKNYPDADMKVCPFNATHVVRTIHYQKHIVECENRDTVELELYRRQGMNRLPPERQVLKPHVTHPAANEEDWDKEALAASYNPTQRIIYKTIAREPPPGFGKASRKLWRTREAQRIELLRKGLPIDEFLITCTDEFGGKYSGDSSTACEGYLGNSFYKHEHEAAAGETSNNHARVATSPMRHPGMILDIPSSPGSSFSQGKDTSVDETVNPGMIPAFVMKIDRYRKETEVGGKEREVRNTALKYLPTNTTGKGESS